MDINQDSFLAELLNDFKIEAAEHYQAIVMGLIELEKNEDILVQKSEIEKIFREAHSLKGASRAVNLLDIEKLCMSLETIFNSLKKNESKLFPPMFDAFHKATDLLNRMLIDVNQNTKSINPNQLMQVIKNLEFVHTSSIQLKKSEKKEEKPIEISVKQVAVQKENQEEHHQDIEIIEDIQTEIQVEEPKRNERNEVQTVRISIEKLNNILQQTEELISIKSTFEYYTKELQNINSQYVSWNRKANEKMIGLNHTYADQETQEFFAAEMKLKKRHEAELFRLNKEMVQFHRVASRMIDELLIDIKTTLLFPFSSMLALFPKLVRDLGKQFSKEIDFEIFGDTIEIDRRILEHLKDPLIHLVRNCIDHGIEKKEVRIAKGKPAKGKIVIQILQNIDRKIELHLSDDGAGLDKDKIIQSALKSGLIKPNDVEKLTDNEIYSFIFSSGISTSPFITDISGRGLGMAIVAENVMKLGGSIELNTIKDSGTTFVITLPQTITTFRGVLTKTADQYFIMPSSAVLKAMRIQYSDIKTVESKKTICYKDEIIALVLLSDVLKISGNKHKKTADEYLYVLIVNISQKKIAFVVDEILNEQEGLVKDLGLQLAHVNNIAGATILGNGKVVPILHPTELIDSASQSGSSIDYSFENAATAGTDLQKRILVAEDSITIRTLLRNFIENAGFLVKTTVDGMEAFDLLQNESFDLVVSDVEMPRMNGFELTAKIRNDKNHTDLPVILVTALETADDKQRGMEVGANAYIVKSSFEKSNLIETIQRLI